METISAINLTLFIALHGKFSMIFAIGKSIEYFKFAKISNCLHLFFIFTISVIS